MTLTNRFSPADQQAFAIASGDHNPLHIDPAFARTVFPGQIIVHGMHALLWAMDRLALPKPINFSGTFLKPILVGEEAEAILDDDVLTLSVRGQPMVISRSADASLAEPKSGQPGTSGTDQTGVVRKGEKYALVKLFPHLSAVWGTDILAGLAGLSTLVGMECPGLYSMFSGFAVTLNGPTLPLSFRVLRRDARFSHVKMAVSGSGLKGLVEAFDTAPTEAITTTDIQPAAGEFAGRAALIVGGSSGLGAATAQLLAAGAGHPIITYFDSADAAGALCRRIRDNGGTCDTLKLDVEHPTQGLERLAAMHWQGREIYYFASPRIFRRRLEVYQSHDFHEFNDIYVDGFYTLLSELFAQAGSAAFKVLYPSSVAVEPLLADMLEYAMAKRLGETLCMELMKKHPALHILIKRLPRIETRQTKSSVKVAAKKPSEIMLPLIRELGS